MSSRAPDSASRNTRVIVVGRTALAGVDAVLRRQRDVELVRTGTPIAAIGESAFDRNPAAVVSPVSMTASQTRRSACSTAPLAVARRSSRSTS